MIRPAARFLAALVSLPLLLPMTATAPAHAVPADPEHRILEPATRSTPEPVSRSARNAPTKDAFEVSIDQVSPAVIPRRGALTLRGSVTNLTDATLRRLNVHPLSSSAPFTTGDELTAAANTAPEISFGGERLQDPAVLDNSIDALEPGERATWRIRIPVDKLRISGGEGVYMVGVQVLSDSADGGRDGLADGRARTFVPLLGPGNKPVPTSIVVPVRRPVAHTAGGRVDGTEEWAAELASDGRLDRVVDLIDGAGDLPVSVLLDPAVPDAVTQLSAGNPDRSLAPTLTPEGEEAPATTAPDAGAEPDEQGGEAEADALTAPLAEAWIGRLVDSLGSSDVLALPYGDLDVAAAARHAPALIEEARERSSEALSSYGIVNTPVVAPAGGLLSTDVVGSLEGTTALLSNLALPEQFATDAAAPQAVDVDGTAALLYGDDFRGADPADRTGAVAMRQRILAEAAVRSLTGDAAPLLVNLPANLDPGSNAARFFDGLDQRFVDVQSLSELRTELGAFAEVEELNYPNRQASAELSSSLFSSAAALTAAGDTLDDILPLNDTIAAQVRAETLAALSYHHRDTQLAAELGMESATTWLTSLLEQIGVSTPSFVILSSQSGPFTMTVSNGLEEPVIFAIEATTSSDLEITAPATIELEANTSRTFTLNARAGNIGVHQVELAAVSPTGKAIGASDKMSIRSNTVGKVIWVILGVGVGILFVAIAIRLVKRMRGKQS